MQQPPIVTIDHNCIIALEHPEQVQQQPIAAAVRALLQLHEAGTLVLTTTSSTLLENRSPRDTRRREVSELLAHYRVLGLGTMDHFRGPQPMMFTDGTGHLFAGVDLELQFLHTIHSLMFPTIDFHRQEYRQRYCREKGLEGQIALIALIGDAHMAPFDSQRRVEGFRLREERPDLAQHADRLDRKWNNAKNDALGLCTHTSYGGRMFVTNDKHFHRSIHSELERLTGSRIVYPVDAVGAFQMLVESTSA